MLNLKKTGAVSVFKVHHSSPSVFGGENFIAKNTKGSSTDFLSLFSLVLSSQAEEETLPTFITSHRQEHGSPNDATEKSLPGFTAKTDTPTAPEKSLLDVQTEPTDEDSVLKDDTPEERTETSKQEPSVPASKQQAPAAASPASVSEESIKTSEDSPVPAKAKEEPQDLISSQTSSGDETVPSGEDSLPKSTAASSAHGKTATIDIDRKSAIGITSHQTDTAPDIPSQPITQPTATTSTSENEEVQPAKTVIAVNDNEPIAKAAAAKTPPAPPGQESSAVKPTSPDTTVPFQEPAQTTVNPKVDTAVSANQEKIPETKTPLDTPSRSNSQPTITPTDTEEVQPAKTVTVVNDNESTAETAVSSTKETLKAKPDSATPLRQPTQTGSTPAGGNSEAGHPDTTAKPTAFSLQAILAKLNTGETASSASTEKSNVKKTKGAAKSSDTITSAGRMQAKTSQESPVQAISPTPASSPQASSDATAAIADRQENPETITAPNRQKAADTAVADSVKTTEALVSKSTAAKQTLAHFAQNLREEVQNYKPPFTRITMNLDPPNLGSIEVTMVSRANQLHLQMQANPTALTLMHHHSSELRQQLAQVGYNDVQMQFSMNQQGQQGRSQHSGNLPNRYLPEEDGEFYESLELIIPRYV